MSPLVCLFLLTSAALAGCVDVPDAVDLADSANDNASAAAAPSEPRGITSPRAPTTTAARPDGSPVASNGPAFGAFSRLSVPCKGSCYEATVAVDGDGRAAMTSGDGDLRVVDDIDSATPTLTTRAPPALPSPYESQQTGDELVQVAPDGRLYWSALVLHYQPLPGGGFVMELAGIQVAASHDGGKSWPQNVVVSVASQQAQTLVFGTDRQWLAFGSDGDVYLVYQGITALASVAGMREAWSSGLWAGHSADGGVTWSTFTQIALGQPEAIAIIGAPLVDANARLLVPFFQYEVGPGPATPLTDTATALRLAISHDKAASFVLSDVWASPSGPGAFFPSLAQAGKGVMLMAWMDAERQLRLSASDDAGATWTAPEVWSNASLVTSPWLRAHTDGTFVLVWAERGLEEGTARLLSARAHLAGGATDLVTLAEPLHGYVGREANTDFVHFDMRDDGRIVAVWSDRDAGAATLAIENAAPLATMS